MFNYFDTYKKLPKRFFTEQKVKPFKELELLALNNELLKSFTTNENLDEDNFINDLLKSNKNSNISQVYAGHQFGHFNPRLGDGRALLLCEIKNKNEQLFDVHLKGSGRTLYSRGGDGYSALGPVIREHILCESMHALGVPTTRAMASFKTNERVIRENREDGGMFARIASSHIRFGTFEYFASQGDIEGLKELADYSINRHYRDLNDSPTKYLDFIHEVIKRNSQMISKWMSLGFIHGVMNTDNMLISGETIDYGPCAFMDTFSFKKVFSSIDRDARYAYDNQINIGIWNIYRLASTLIPLINENEDIAIETLKKELENIQEIYKEAYTEEFYKKLGLRNQSDTNLIQLLLTEMEEKKDDFTITFKNLAYDHKQFKDYLFYKEWLSKNPDFEIMKKSNPCFIPRNHQVQKAIDMAYKKDFSHFRSLLKRLKNPYRENEELEKAPTVSEEVISTFCGT